MRLIFMYLSFSVGESFARVTDNLFHIQAHTTFCDPNNMFALKG